MQNNKKAAQMASISINIHSIQNQKYHAELVYIHSKEKEKKRSSQLMGVEYAHLNAFKKTLL